MHTMMHVLPFGSGHSVMGKGNREHEKTVENRCGSRLPVSAGRMRARAAGGRRGARRAPGGFYLCAVRYAGGGRAGGHGRARGVPRHVGELSGMADVRYLRRAGLCRVGGLAAGQLCGSGAEHRHRAGAPFRGRGVPQRSVSLEPPCNGRAGAGPRL